MKKHCPPKVLNHPSFHIPVLPFPPFPLGMAQPSLGKAMDHYGGRICIPSVQVAIALTLLAFGSWQRPADRLELHAEVGLRELLGIGVAVGCLVSLVCGWILLRWVGLGGGFVAR